MGKTIYVCFKLPVLVRNLSCENKFYSCTSSVKCKSNSFSYDRFCTRTRFETEAKGSSQMAYCQDKLARVSWQIYWGLPSRGWYSWSLRFMQETDSQCSEITVKCIAIIKKHLNVWNWSLIFKLQYIYRDECLFFKSRNIVILPQVWPSFKCWRMIPCHFRTQSSFQSVLEPGNIYRSISFINLLIPKLLHDAVEPPLTATSVQRPWFFVPTTVRRFMTLLLL